MPQPKKLHWARAKSRWAKQLKGKITACGHGGRTPVLASRMDEVTCITCAWEVDHARWWWGGDVVTPFAMCGYCGERIDPSRDEVTQRLCRRCIDEWQERHGHVDPEGELLLELVGYDPTPLSRKQAEKELFKPRRPSRLPPPPRPPSDPSEPFLPHLFHRVELVRRLLGEPRLQLVKP